MARVKRRPWKGNRTARMNRRLFLHRRRDEARVKFSQDGRMQSVRYGLQLAHRTPPRSYLQIALDSFICSLLAQHAPLPFLVVQNHQFMAQVSYTDR
jgi:hypothetical protein